MKGYKAFKSDWTCRGFQYEIGKTYELEDGQELQMCQCGFHFCKNPIDVFGYYPMDDKTLIAEVEALGDIQQEGTKYVTNKIRIVKEFTRKQLQALNLDGKYNTGEDNSGDWNSGNRNSGNWNSGDCNSGIFNTNEPKMRAFNKECDITYTEFVNSLNYSWWDFCNRVGRKNLNDKDIDRIKTLPNFDAEIFKEITGIEVE